MLDGEQVQRYLEKEVIEIIPLAYMRGRTLNQTFMILDEGQNTTVTRPFNEYFAGTLFRSCPDLLKIRIV